MKPGNMAVGMLLMGAVALWGCSSSSDGSRSRDASGGAATGSLRSGDSSSSDTSGSSGSSKSRPGGSGSVKDPSAPSADAQGAP